MWSRRSVRTRYLILGCTWFFIGAPLVATALVAQQNHVALWIAFALLFAGLGAAGTLLRCPRCGYFVLKKRPGLTISPRIVGRPPKDCPKCGLRTSSSWPSGSMRAKLGKVGMAWGIIAAVCLLGVYVIIAYGIDRLVLTLSNWLTSP